MNQTAQKPIQTLQELAQNLRTDCYYFVSQFGLGDTYYLIALKTELERKFGSKIIFVIQPSHEIVCELFECEDYVICTDTITIGTHKCLNLDNFTPTPTLAKLYPAHPIPLDILHKLNHKDMKDLYINFFGLNTNAILAKPSKMPILNQNLRDKIQICAPLNKIIFYLPEANSMQCLPYVIFALEVQRLQKQGYTIIVNITKEPKYLRVKGVLNFHLSSKEAVALALNCAGVISMRSGFCDTIALNCKNLKVYYPNKECLKGSTLKVIDKAINAQEVSFEDFSKTYEILVAQSKFSLPFKLYQRYIAKGFLRRVRTPFTLYFKIYLGHKKDEMKKSSPQCEVATSQAAQSHSELAQEFKNSSNQNLPNQTLNDKEMREFEKEFIQNELSQTYEFRLGLLLQKACERFWRGGFLAFPFAYLKLRKKKRHLQRISEII